MKKLTAVFTLLLVLASMFAFTANADEDYGMTIAVDANTDSLKVGDTFSVVAAVTNINDPKGLAVVEYVITYDKNVLELEDVEHKLPDIWEKYLNTDYFDNLSHRDDSDEYTANNKLAYVWALTSNIENNALFDGGKLSLTLKFKVIGEGKASVDFQPQTNTNDDFIELTANRVTVNLQIGDPDAQNPEKSVDISGSIGEIPEKSGSFVVWLIVGLVVLFAAVLGGVYFFARKKQK